MFPPKPDHMGRPTLSVDPQSSGSDPVLVSCGGGDSDFVRLTQDNDMLLFHKESIPDLVRALQWMIAGPLGRIALEDET